SRILRPEALPGGGTSLLYAAMETGVPGGRPDGRPGGPTGKGRGVSVGELNWPCRRTAVGVLGPAGSDGSQHRCGGRLEGWVHRQIQPLNAGIGLEPDELAPGVVAGVPLNQPAGCHQAQAALREGDALLINTPSPAH